MPEEHTERTTHTGGRWWRRGQHLKELASDMSRIMVEEWDSRTKFGKALYPLWLVNAIMMWIMAFSIFTMVVIAAPFVRLIRDDWPNWGLLPSIYKEGENEETQ